MRKRLLFFAWSMPMVSLIGVPSAAQETSTYTYDSLGRLIASSVSGGPAGGTQTGTTFDTASNRAGYTIAGPAIPSFAISNASAIEGGTLTFTVIRTGGTSTANSVNFATASGTAISGSDFTANSGTLTFASGETSKTINVSTIDDNVIETAETMLVNLSSPTGGATIATAQGSGTINDNDAGNQPPVANADSFSIRCNMLNTLATLVSNDTDPEGNLPLVLLSVTRISGSATIEMTGPGNIVTVGGAPSVGVSTFSYVVRDSLGASSSGTATVTTITGPFCT